MNSKCKDCIYSDWDYEEYYGGYEKPFICGCKKDREEFDSDIPCEAFKETRRYE